MEAPCKPPMFLLPTIQKKYLSRNFDLEPRINSEVTALDISAHGAHVLVGFGNGFILLYDMTSSFHRNYDIVGHIQAKGLHTNLLLKLKITSDSRFCFAGVTKGSSEMVAIDLGKLPVWGNSLTIGKKQTRSIAECVSSFTHQDPKLRGLGDAVAVVDDSHALAKEYRLVCGLGIKNIHIWQFVPPDVAEGSTVPQWTCVFDFATNGNTIECAKFRGFNQVLSKSTLMNIRIWNLDRGDDVVTKPTFVDIPNTQDARVIMSSFCFGGTYDLAVVRLDASGKLNRDEFEIPGRSTEDDKGQRRKRMMRQIDEIIGTDDGKHVLVLCTDGGVLYFNCAHPLTQPQCTEDMPFSGELTECATLNRDIALDNAWTVRRVGRVGETVLLRAVTQYCPDGLGTTTIMIRPLSEECDGGSHNFQEDMSHQGFYFNSTSLHELEEEVPERGVIPLSLSRPPKAPVSSDSGLIPGGDSIPRTPSMQINNKCKDGQQFSPVSPRTSVDEIKKSRAMPAKVSTPAPAPLRASIGISPLIDSQKYQGNETPKEKKVFVAKKGAGPEMLEAPRRSVGPVRIEPPPKFRRIAESNSILEPANSRRDLEWSNFQKLQDSWLHEMGNSLVTELPWGLESSIGKQARLCLLEQSRLRAQFCSEVCRTLGVTYVHSICSGGVATTSRAQSVAALVDMYSKFVDDLLKRQQLELECAENYERLRLSSGSGKAAGQTSSTGNIVFPFHFSQMFPRALEFADRVDDLIKVASTV